MQVYNLRPQLIPSTGQVAYLQKSAISSHSHFIIELKGFRKSVYFVFCHAMAANLPPAFSQFCVIASPANRWQFMKLKTGCVTGLTKYKQNTQIKKR
jgi:hypothetical protein